MESQAYVLLGAGGILAYILWKAVYNYHFHPLAKVPGPWLPSVTGWYEVYFDCIYKGGGQYPFHLKTLHDKYGPIIRPTPDQVHISDPQFLEVIYASRNRNQVVNRGLQIDHSVAGAEDFKLHRMRREALNPYFSLKAVFSLQWLLNEKKAKVIALLGNAIKTQRTTNLSDVFFAYSNDFVRAFSFGSDDDLLSDLDQANTQRTNLARLLTGVHLQRHFTTFFRVVGQVMPLITGMSALPPGVVDIIRFKRKTRKDIEAVLADTTNDNKGRHSVFYELRDTSLLPPAEKTVDRLQDEATILVMAGTESTAKSLSIAAFYLIKRTEIMEKLRKEIAYAKRESAEDIPLAKLLTLPYLSGLIYEANRLSYGVTGRMKRYSPDETLKFTATSGPHAGTTYVLPPRTVMSTLTYCAHTDESVFPHPSEFDPERWIISPTNQEEKVNRRKRCLLALGKGHRKCIGINVANAALSLILAELVNYDMELVATDESDIEFQRDFQISHPKEGSLGVRARVTGKHQN